MVRIYCQYSYGGFKNFPIEGVKDELLDKEVSNENSYGFPPDANIFFSYGGIKMVYRQLNNGEYTLVIKEIPSAHTDSDGRPIICAVQFIGDEDDRLTLDNMAITIANNINDFESFFRDLFFEREGLRIEGDKLRTYIDSFNVDYVFSGESKLLNIQGVNAKVLLLVALSSNFGIDKAVTEKVLCELNLEQDAKNSRKVVLTYPQLIKQQNNLVVLKNKVESNIKPVSSTAPAAPIPATDVTALTAPSTPSQEVDLTSLESRCVAIEDKQTELSGILPRLIEQHNAAQREIFELKKHFKILAGAFIVLLLIELIGLIF